MLVEYIFVVSVSHLVKKSLLGIACGIFFYKQGFPLRLIISLSTSIASLKFSTSVFVPTLLINMAMDTVKENI
jgi:hypothetical protein